MLLILDLIRRDRLQERYSVVWFVAGLGMLVGAAFPGLLSVVADVMGVRDTNVALFSIVLLLLLGLALNFSVIMSRQAAQITRLAQERALEKARRQTEGEESNGGEPENPSSELALVIEHPRAVRAAFEVGEAAALVEGAGFGVGLAGVELDVGGAGLAGGLDRRLEQGAADALAAPRRGRRRAPRSGRRACPCSASG